MAAKARSIWMGLASARSGVAAIEFGLVSPVLLLALAGTVDFGSAFVAKSKLDAAVSAAANYALLNYGSVNSSGAGGLAQSLATIVSSVNGSNWANGTVTVNNGPSVTVTGGKSITGGTAANADLYYCLTGAPPNWVWGTGAVNAAACANGTTTGGKFVTITATYTFVPLFHYSFLPSGTMTANVAVQTQ